MRVKSFSPGSLEGPSFLGGGPAQLTRNIAGPACLFRFARRAPRFMRAEGGAATTSPATRRSSAWVRGPAGGGPVGTRQMSADHRCLLMARGQSEVLGPDHRRPFLGSHGRALFTGSWWGLKPRSARPIALIQDGEGSRIDAEDCTIDPGGRPDRAGAARRKSWEPRKINYGSGAIWKFAQQVGPAHLGAADAPRGGRGRTRLRGSVEAGGCSSSPLAIRN